MYEDPNENWQQETKAPGGLFWPIRRAGWFLEKHLLWPVADSFRKFANAFRYRSPFAYIGVTLMVTVTAGAIAAAVYFHNQSTDPTTEPLAADTVVPAEAVVPAVPTPAPAPVPGQDTTPNSGDADTTLQGVTPNFSTAGRQKNGKKKPQLPATVVRPAPVPKAAPLKVAHSFASTFANYEVGKKGAADRFTKSATTKLARDLKKNPPKLPANGQIPKATVVNVVRGKKDGDRMAVSVSLMRSGGSSELRLGLTRKQGDGWLVSEVRG